MFQNLSLRRYGQPPLSQRVIPWGDGLSGEFTLIHSVGLLDSQDPFFVRVGLSRMTKMLRTENGAKKVIEASVVTKCQMLLDSHTDRSSPPTHVCCSDWNDIPFVQS